MHLFIHSLLTEQIHLIIHEFQYVCVCVLVMMKINPRREKIDIEIHHGKIRRMSLEVKPRIVIL